MKSRFAIPAALVATCAFAFTASGEQSITLKQAYPLGKKIHQTIELTQKMKMEGIPGAPGGDAGMNMTNKIDMGMSFDVQKHGEGKKSVIAYDKMAMALDAGVFKQSFDSDDDGSPFAGLVGKKITVIYDKDEQVESVEGLDELLEGAGTDPTAGMLIQQMLSEEQVKQTMNQGLLQDVPDKELKIGDKWDFDMTTPLPQGGGKIVVKGTYTVKKFETFEEHPCVVIRMDGKLETEGKQKMNIQGQQMDMEFKDSTFEGDIYFDNKLGLPRKTDMLTKMKMSMALGDIAPDITMDMNMTMISKISKIEDSK